MFPGEAVPSTGSLLIPIHLPLKITEAQCLILSSWTESHSLNVLAEPTASWSYSSNQWSLLRGTICWPSISDHSWPWRTQNQMYVPSLWACPTFLLQGSPQEVRRLVTLGHQHKWSLHQHVFQLLLSSPVRGISSCSAKREIAGVQSNTQKPTGNVPSRKI